ncbi:MAG: PorV/PorQ family protein [Candidatus Zhuqueibacterota bacterium]
MALHRTVIILSLVACLGATESGFSQTQKKRSSLNYYGIGARASVLNAAFVSIADDYSATHWNPAGLTASSRYNFGGMHSQMPLSRENNFVSFSMPVSQGDWLGLSWQGFTIDQIEARSSNSATPDYYFYNVEEAIWLTYARRIFSPVSLGINLKYLHQAMDGVGANGVGLDIGLLAQLTSNLKLGVVVYDIGSALHWKTDHRDEYERMNRIGIAYQIYQPLVVSLALEGYEQRMQELSLGAEYILLNALAVRAGWQDRRFSLGTGLDVAFNNVDFSFNYSIASNKLSHELTNLSEISVSFPFTKFRAVRLVQITCSTLNVRSGPGTHTEKITELYMGQKFEIKEQKLRWLKIEYDRDKTGWIDSNFAVILDE